MPVFTPKAEIAFPLELVVGGMSCNRYIVCRAGSPRHNADLLSIFPVLLSFAPNATRAAHRHQRESGKRNGPKTESRRRAVYRTADAALRGPAAGARRGQVFRRHLDAGPGDCRVRALTARPRHREADRRSGRANDAGRDRGPDRRRLRGRWVERRGAARQPGRRDRHQGARLRAGETPGAGGAAISACSSTACAIRAKRSRWWWRNSCFRRATPPRRWRSNTRCCRAVTDLREADGAETIWASAPDNIALDQEFGDAAAVRAAFDAADLVVEQTFRNQRIANAQMEPRSGVACLRRGNAILHADFRQPGRPRAAHGAGGKFWAAAREGPLRLPRCRRRLWPSQQSLSRAGRHPVGE